MRAMRKDRGFTLVEVLMAVFIGLILLAAVYVSMTTGQRSSAGVERKVAAQQDVRAALDVMAMEVSMASYNPNFIPAGVWREPPIPTATNPCTGASLNQGWKGIQEAGPTGITVEMDILRSNAIGDNPNEIIRYALSGQSVVRNTNCGGDETFLGANPLLPAGTNTVRVINGALGINNGNGLPAIFRYYNGRQPAQELFPDTTPTDVVNIRRIDITLGVETEERDPSTHQRRRMIYSTSVLVRNHVLN
jgi:prepilin-type N-terminal cleavage/methylation domain-containing protein